MNRGAQPGIADAVDQRTALVTGGTDGIGKEVARGMARAAHRVLLVGRDKQKGARAVKEIYQSTGNPNVEFLAADLSLMSEANRLADEIASRSNRLNYLVHSAGVVRDYREMTEEGLESNFAINYLSRFVLTQRLLPLMKVAGRLGDTARIVIISGAARNGTIYFDDVNLASRFGLVKVVGQVCQANDVFAVEQARRLADDNVVTITCLKMGVVKTNIRNGRGFPWWMKLLVPLILDPLVGQTPKEAAESALRLLLAEEYEGVTGALFLKIREFKRIALATGVSDPETGRRLWELSERLSATARGSANDRLPLPAQN